MIILGLSKTLRRIFLIGDTKIERILSLMSILLLLFTIITFSYWLFIREYSKYTITVLMCIGLFAGTLALRIKIIEEKERILKLARENYERLGLSLEEAEDYFKYKFTLTIFKQWLVLIVGILLITLLIIAFFPI